MPLELKLDEEQLEAVTQRIKHVKDIVGSQYIGEENVMAWKHALTVLDAYLAERNLLTKEEERKLVRSRFNKDGNNDSV